MAFYCALQREKYKLIISEDPFTLTRDFTPPELVESANVTVGTSANRYRGAKLQNLKSLSTEFSFTVIVRGDTSMQVEEAGKELIDFLRSGDSRYPVYLLFRPELNTSFEPVHGVFGKMLRAKVVRVISASKSGQYYGSGNFREHALFIQISVLINPPEGDRLLVAVAKGGVTEEWWTSPLGKSRGVMVPEATTNLHTDPIMMGSGWTFGSNIIYEQISDPDHTSLGENAYRIISKGTTNNTVTQSLTLTAVTHTAYYHVKKQDLSAVTDTDCAVIYNGVQRTSFYYAIGNGWYRVSASYTGTGGAAAAGLIVFNTKAIYLGHAQCEAKGYPTAPCHGYMPDSSWTSTPHASTSARLVASLKLDLSRFFSQLFGTIRIEWKADRNYDQLPANIYLFDTGDGTPTQRLRLLYDTATSKWTATDTAFSAVSNLADQFSTGAKRIFYVTWGPSGIKLYEQGVLRGSSSFLPAAPGSFGDYLYLGSTATPANHANGTIMGFAHWDYELTATEVSADSGNITGWMNGGDGFGKYVDPIAYLWNKDGDWNFDNLNDSTRDNWGYAGSIPGSLPAKTEWSIDPNSTVVFNKAFWMGAKTLTYKNFRKHEKRYWVEGSGTADVGNASGDAYYNINLPTTLPRSGLTTSLESFAANEMDGNFHFFIRAKANAAHTVNVGFFITYRGINVYSTDKVIALDATYRLFYIGKLAIKPFLEILRYNEMDIEWAVNFGCADGGGSLHIDFACVMNGKMLWLDAQFNDIPGGSGSTTYPLGFRLQEKDMIMDYSGYVPIMTGDDINLEPGVYNLMSFLFADDAGAHSLSEYSHISSIYVTPRWAFA